MVEEQLEDEGNGKRALDRHIDYLKRTAAEAPQDEIEWPDRDIEMPDGKVWAVAQGRRLGIYTDWDRCETRI